MTWDATIRAEAAALLAALQARGLWVTTAESCTGGMIAGAITAIAGSSASLSEGYVTYSNAAKARLLSVPAPMLAAHGAVSEPVAQAMALGALASSGADLALACTGIAGPGGAVPGKPVGTVFIAAAMRRRAAPAEARQGEAAAQATRPGLPYADPVAVIRFAFPGDRDAVRTATVIEALRLGIKLLRDNGMVSA